MKDRLRAYIAVFTPEEGGKYSVNFPDFESCYTCGDSLPDAIMMAEDVLAYTLYDFEKNKLTIPNASLPQDIVLKEGEFTNYIACDTFEYRKHFDTKVVKKTLTIPSWLNEAALDMGINFSQLLQEALLNKLNA